MSNGDSQGVDLLVEPLRGVGSGSGAAEEKGKWGSLSLHIHAGA